MEINNNLPQLDLSNEAVPELPSVDYSPIPDGVYDLKLTDYKYIKDKGFNFTFSVVGGSFNNRKVFYYTNPFSNENTIKYFKHFLVSLGFTTEEVIEIGRNLNKYLGATVDLNIRAKVITESYKNSKGEDKTASKVKFFYKARTELANPTNLLAIYKDKLGYVDKIAGQTTSEDIPF